MIKRILFAMLAALTAGATELQTATTNASVVFATPGLAASSAWVAGATNSNGNIVKLDGVTVLCLQSGTNALVSNGFPTRGNDATNGTCVYRAVLPVRHSCYFTANEGAIRVGISSLVSTNTGIRVPPYTTLFLSDAPSYAWFSVCSETGSVSYAALEW